MPEDESLALLREIRDLGREQLAASRVSLANQAQSIANQELVLKRQQESREFAGVSRKWGRITFWIIVALAFIYVLQPMAFMFFARRGLG